MVNTFEDFEVQGTSLRSLPKVSLHDHLDGALRPQTIIELGQSIGLELPDTNPAGLAEWFTQQCNAGSLVEYLKTFDLTTAVMQTREGLTRVAREFVQDLAADGVVYGEVRWAPEQHLQGGLSLDEVVEAVQLGIEEGEDDAERQARTHAQMESVFPTEEDGLAAWMVRLPANGTLRLPDPAEGGGQYLIVASGTMLHEGRALDTLSTVYVTAAEPAFDVAAGATGADILVLQFPRAGEEISGGGSRSN